jgi:hypothetical protein
VTERKCGIGRCPAHRHKKNGHAERTTTRCAAETIHQRRPVHQDLL